MCEKAIIEPYPIFTKVKLFHLMGDLEILEGKMIHDAAKQRRVYFSCFMKS